MGSAPRVYENEGIYHVFNRGVEKRVVFTEQRDYQRFLDILLYYQQAPGYTQSFAHVIDFEPTNRVRPFRAELLAYTFMPNHFHLLLRQTMDGGISSLMSKTLNSYTKYFNTKYQRVGHLFQGKFQIVPVTKDEQLMHVLRYILLNPYVAGLTTDPLSYPYSSLRELLGEKDTSWCDTQFIANFFPGPSDLKRFVLDYAEEARVRELITKHRVD